MASSLEEVPMPVRVTYPGVYIEEIASGVRPVTAVATSTAAFIGTFRKGLLNEAVRLLSFADFEREYGGLDRSSEASYAVQQFFLNGGSEAWVVRVGQPAPPVAPATDATLAANGRLDSFAGAPILSFFAGRRIRGGSASNPGSWGNFLRIEVEHTDSALTTNFHLFVSEVAISGGRTTVLQTEVFRNLTMEPDTPNYAVEVVNQGSRLIQITRASGLSDFTAPAANGTVTSNLTLPVAVTDIDDLTITLSLGSPLAAVPGMPITLNIDEQLTVPPGLPIPPNAAVVPADFLPWATALQIAIRNAATDPNVEAKHRPYFTGATVTHIGTGTAASPHRFVIKAGKAAQSFDSDAEFSFGDADVANYGLGAATATLAQQFKPSAVTGDNGSVTDPLTGNYLVPAASFRGNALLKTGLYALDDMDLVNIIAMPDVPRMSADSARSVYAEAIAYAESRRSMIMVDIPNDVITIDQMHTWLADNESLRHPNAAVYYPRTFTPDPLNQNRQRSLASSGTIGGLWARTDTNRGVWKAPAGTEARLRNVESLTYVMTDLENGTLNPLGVNCLRNFPVYSNICWGARTLDGADAIASDFKYIPVRRTTLFIEESLYRGTKWVVFEPNDEPLWSQIRLNVGAFMHDLFRKGAFQGKTPREAYSVKCDGETTTQTDIDNGIVNIEVGFAPLKPAEFVILKIQQIASVTAE
jgi:uncharacterized protein